MGPLLPPTYLGRRLFSQVSVCPHGKVPRDGVHPGQARMGYPIPGWGGGAVARSGWHTPGWGNPHPPPPDRLCRGRTFLLTIKTMRGSLSVARSHAPGCEPLVTGNLAMGLTIRSSHKQELSSVYQFIDVLYSLCIYEALRHWSLSCPLLRVFSVLVVSSCLVFSSTSALYCAGLYILD